MVFGLMILGCSLPWTASSGSYCACCATAKQLQNDSMQLGFQTRDKGAAADRNIFLRLR